MKKFYAVPWGLYRSYWIKSPSLLLQGVFSLLVISCWLSTNLSAQSQTFNSSGTFVVPTGVTSITVQSWGAGGGGASGGGANRAGGGGGAFATSTFAVVPGTSYTVTVGAGGTPGQPGGSSSFGVVVVAVGGNQGAGLSPGLGGQAAASTPTIGAFSGGNGGGSSVSGGQDAGGGGGGAATSSAAGRAGANGSTAAGGAGGLAGGGAGSGGGAGGQGDGGNGAFGALSVGQNGFAPGGGGGGRAENITSLGAGSGANGRVSVSWACALDVTFIATSVTQPVCEDGPATITLTANAVPAGTYSVVYSVSGANTASNVNTTVTFTGGTGSFTTGNLNNDGNTTVTINLLGCGAPPFNNVGRAVTFNVDDGPATPGAITGGAIVCDNIPGLVYSIAAVPGATSYTWTVPTGWQITAGQGTTSITVTSGALNQGGVISVVANGTCGTSAPRLLVVLANANNIGFFANAVDEVTLCEDEVTNPLILLADNLQGNDPSGGQTYAWQAATAPTGPFAAGVNAGEADDQVYNNVLNDYNTPGVYYFRRIITNNAYCGAADTSMIITLNIDSEIDSFYYSADTITFCANTAITPLTPTISGGVGATFTVSPALPAGLTLNATTGVISGTPTTATAPAFYTIVATNDCGSATTSINITVAAAPTITVNDPGDSCEGDGSTRAVTITVTGGTAPYTISYGFTRIYVGANCEPLGTGPAGIVYDADGIYTVSFTGAPAGAYTFSASVTDTNGCSATATNVEFNIFALPVGNALTRTIYSCNRVNVNLQNQINCNLASTFTWYSVTAVGSSVAYNNPNVDGETFAAPGSGATINDLLTNTSTVSQVIIYRVVPTSVNGGCAGAPFYITITVLAPTEPACVACMNEVNVSLDANCSFTVLPNHVLDFSRCENGDVLREALEVVVSGSNSNVITCAGTYTYVIRLRPEYERCFRFSPCWGKIIAEDKTPPALVCAPLDFTLDCYDVNYVLNNRLTIGNVGATGSPRPAATGNQTIFNAEGVVGVGPALPVCAANLIPPGLVSDNIKNLGYAYFRDNCYACGCRVTLKWADKVVFYSCEQMRTNGGIYATISREWVATDCKGMSSSYVQKIHFTRPDLDDFVFNGPGDGGKYDRVVEYNSCTPDKSLIKKEDVTPYICSYFNTTANPRCLFIDQVECNYSVSIKDTEFPICGGKGVKIDREIYVFDWCAGGIVDTFHVLIKIGDFTAPTVEYAHGAPYDISTGPMDCTASIPVTVAGIKSLFGVTIKDNCALGNVSVSVYTKDRYVKGILVYEGPANPFCDDARRKGELRGDHENYQLGACDKDEICWDKVDYAVMNGMMIGLPVGRHLLVIEAFDGCYNTSTTCFIFDVKDKIAPVMKCDDDLHVTLSNANGYTSGYAQVSADDIDEGSWDNCKLAWLAVRRNVPDACAASFIAKGYDTNGNGKLDALPADGDWTKADGFDRNGDGDLADFGETFILKGGKLMTPLADFVEFFCCDLTERVTVELWGEDTAGNTNYCWMDLLIEDKVAPTCLAPWDLTIYCDDKGIAQLDDKVASGKIFGDITIPSGNDCASLDTVYSTVKSLKCGYGYIDRIWTLTKQTVKGPISITCKQRINILPVHEYDICFPKDVSTDCKTPVIDTVITDELACDILAVNVSDKRYDASDDECYKIFRTYTVINWCVYDDRCGDPMAEGHVYVVDRATFGNYGKAPLYVLVRDREENRRDGIEEFYLSKDLIARNADDIRFRPPFCEASNEFYHSFMYTQIIKVYDDVRPVVTGPAAEFCIREGGDCLANIKMVVNATDNCTDKIELETQYLMIAPNQTTDAGKMILYSTPRWSTKDLGNGQFEINVSNLPEGKHDLIVVVRDECGNLSVATRIPFTVKDCKGPAPICINGLSTELMSDGNNGGMMAVWASDFVASKIYDCNGQGPETLNGLKLVTKYSINRVGQPVVSTQTGINLTCADKGKVVLVELHAWDNAGNNDFCVTYVEVQDNRGVCPGSATGDVSIAGTISTEGAGNLQGAAITLSGAASQNANTSATGGYSFINLAKGGDFTVTPQLDKNHLNGVSTFDLVLIQKHILGVQALNSPYKMIAADVNSSKSISTLDLIALRKLILNIDTHFANNTSWRFVDAGYNFPNAKNPWAASFPEVVSVNDIAANATANFIAIKVGDVNASATVSAAASAEVRTFGTLNIEAAEAALKAGQEYSVEFTAADLKNVQGYQFALNLDKSKVEMVDIIYGVAKAENFGVFQNEGIITTSWNSEYKQGALFTLVLRAKADAQLSTALSLNRVVSPEAYSQNNEQLSVALQFGKAEALAAGFELKQNTPNPFNAETVISFNLPKAMAATLTISDVTGRVLKSTRADYAKGSNQVTLKAGELNASGVLYYTLEADEFTATRKMIIVE